MRMPRHRLRPLALSAILVAGCSSAPPDDGPAEPGEITLEVISPLPGAELLASADPVITVTGTAATTSPDGALSVWVNGDAVRVSADGSFTAEIAPALGINHIQVEGRDGLSNPVERRLDVLWAPAYLPPVAGTTGFDIPGALELRLAQRFLDTRLIGSDLDLSGDPVVASNLAQVVELVLWNMDLAGLLEGGIHIAGDGEGGARLDVEVPFTEVRGGVVVDAEILSGPLTGIVLHIDLLDIFLAMDGVFAYDQDQWLIEGGLAADMHASALVSLEMLDDGQLAVAVTDVEASVGPLAPEFVGEDGDTLNGFIAVSGSNFRRVIEGMITEELIPTFTDGLPPLFGGLLSALDDLFSDVSFDLDAGVGQPVTVLLDSQISALEVVAGPPLGVAPGHITVRQDLAIRTSGEPLHPGSRGAARADAMPSPPFGNVAGVHLALRQDFLNSLLHALWNAGLLDGVATVGDLEARVRADLPPFVREAPLSSSCRIDGERCDVIVQLGQIEVDLAELEQRFVLSASAGARIQVTDGAVSLAIQPTPEIRVWEISEQPGVITPEAMHDLVLDLVWPELVGALADNLNFPLPLPALSDLGLDTIAPGLAGATLELVMRQRLSVASGYLGLAADLELEAPPSPDLTVRPPLRGF